MVARRVLSTGLCVFVSFAVGCSSCQDDVREDPWAIEDRADQSNDMKDIGMDLSADMPSDMADDLQDAGVDQPDDMKDMVDDMPSEATSRVMASVHLGRQPYRNYNVNLPMSGQSATEVLIEHPKQGEPCVRYTYKVLRAGPYVFDSLNNNRGYKGEPDCPHTLYQRGGPRFEQRTGVSQVFDASPDVLALSPTGELFVALTNGGVIYVLDPTTLSIRQNITLPGDDFENATFDLVKQMVVVGDMLHILVSQRAFSAIYTIDTKTYEVVDRDPNTDGVQRLELSSLVRARQMAVSPGGQWLAVQFDGTTNGEENSGLQILDAKTLTLQHTIERVGFEPVFGHVAFKDDQTLMASRRAGRSAAGTSALEIKMFDVLTGKEREQQSLVAPGFHLNVPFLYSPADERVWVYGRDPSLRQEYFIARYRLDGQQEQRWTVSQFITNVLLLPSVDASP